MPDLIIRGTDANVFMLAIRRRVQQRLYMVEFRNASIRCDRASLLLKSPLIFLIRFTAASYVFWSAEKRAATNDMLLSWFLNKRSRCSGLKSVIFSKIFATAPVILSKFELKAFFSLTMSSPALK